MAGQLDAPRPDRFVLIHQMGKVGSRSIHAALAGHPEVGHGAVGNSHWISDNAYRRHLWSRALPWGRVSPAHREMTNARRVLFETDRPIDLICPVREPIARNVSNFFFLMSLGHWNDLTPAAIESHPDPLQRLRLAFAAKGDHVTPERWFGDELRAALGIDALAEPFDAELGWRVSEHGRVRLLVLRSDLPDDRKAAVIADYLGVAPFALGRENTAEGREVDGLYQRFKRSPGLWPEYADWLHGLPFAKLFFTEADLASAKARWCRDGDESQGRAGPLVSASPPNAA